MNQILKHRKELALVIMEGELLLPFFTEAISTIPVAGRVVAGFVAVAVLNPRPWAALSTVRDRPGQVHLHTKWEINSQEIIIFKKGMQIINYKIIID